MMAAPDKKAATRKTGPGPKVNFVESRPPQTEALGVEGIDGSTCATNLGPAAADAAVNSFAVHGYCWDSRQERRI